MKKMDASPLHVIETHPDILGGKPVVAGTRIPVTIIFDMVGCGYTIDQILVEYPTLTKHLIIEVLKTGSELKRCLDHVNLTEIIEKELAC